MVREFQIIGTRTLSEDIYIIISPMNYFSSDSALKRDAQILVNILRTYLPVRTYNYLKDILIKE